MDRHSLGKDAERNAENWLETQGLQLIQRNMRCRLGEIDLIMTDGESLIFIEVRQRNTRAFGGAAASVDWRKQRKLLRAARFFLAANPAWSKHPCRFDVIAYEGNDIPLWYRNAFQN
ncbi:MAG: YraN family protein [Nitrincola lacisaponensis]|uniref:YraN family protein n=1 Tax=Nitrincola lacisaponensis TaxID=267850 RepID=UPI00391C633F